MHLHLCSCEQYFACVLYFKHYTVRVSNNNCCINHC